MKLFTYWRSLATFRVRIALNMKGLAYEPVTVDLHAGDQLGQEFRAINPMGALPVLVEDDGTSLDQSLAIMEYLDERYPKPPLLPKDAAGRARVRALAQMTVADAHPLIVPRVRNHLAATLGASLEQVNAWGLHWMKTGLDAYERRLARDAATGDFCHGDSITIADIGLVSHSVGMRYFGGTIDNHPTVKRIVGRCLADERVAGAHPLRQPGAPDKI
ncbi:MAG TPA: maleylacetoacetate isomerase [Hyphomicrobiales bacterium]|jgi:maleylacetoacetate isomerase